MATVDDAYGSHCGSGILSCINVSGRRTANPRYINTVQSWLSVVFYFIGTYRTVFGDGFTATPTLFAYI
jgi:hypothetical protein